MEALEVGYQPLTVYNDLIELRTEEPTQFIDLTERVAFILHRSGVTHGIVQIRVLHTTAAIVVNENEPLLLDDFKAMLERLAPRDAAYAHDDPLRRRVNLELGERSNGHAHLRALLLGESRQITVVDGMAELGRWQSIFLVELDGPRKRSISITVMGHRGTSE
jgi:secondary thiamine-phosphate synthase enzyme